MRVGDPGRHYSNRVEDYVRYRPDYPLEVVAFIAERCGVTLADVVADVGCGTGLLSRLFLENGNVVFGVEPNDEMRAAAERLLAEYPRFRSVAGSAEATTLADGSVDLVVAGNALHWVDLAAARTEFRRILRAGGRVAAVWNGVRDTATPFLEALEKVLARHRRQDAAAGAPEEMYRRTEDLFGVGGTPGYEMAEFVNEQVLDLAGLQGLVLSHSNLPARGEPGSEAMCRDLAVAFREYEPGGTVTLRNVARVYCGRLA